MVTESYNVREFSAPKTDITQIKVKKFDVRESVDADGVVHQHLVEKTIDDFLDVPFRDFSMSTYVATGEVTRLKYVSPIKETNLDILDRVSADSEEISARIDHMELMQQVAASSEQPSADK